jgi:hypothetical protein
LVELLVDDLLPVVAVVLPVFELLSLFSTPCQTTATVSEDAVTRNSNAPASAKARSLLRAILDLIVNDKFLFAYPNLL